jgi:hypothetical protein
MSPDLAVQPQSLTRLQSCSTKRWPTLGSPKRPAVTWSSTVTSIRDAALAAVVQLAGNECVHHGIRIHNLKACS